MLSVHFGRKASSGLPQNLFWANSPVVQMLKDAQIKCGYDYHTIEWVHDIPNEYKDGRLPIILSHQFYFGLEARSCSDTKILRVFLEKFLSSDLMDSLFIVYMK